MSQRRVSPDTPVGAEFVGAQKTPTQERADDFSGGFPKGPGWPNRTIHTSLEFARQCGVRSCVIAGAMNEGYLAELLIDMFGIEWLTNGRMSVKFVAIVQPGDTVVAKATVRARAARADSVRFELDLSCENQRGQTVVAGTAVGVV